MDTVCIDFDNKKISKAKASIIMKEDIKYIQIKELHKSKLYSQSFYNWVLLGLVKEAKSIISGLDGLKIQFKNTWCLHADDLQILITIIVIKALSQPYYNPLYEFRCVIPVNLETNLTHEVWFRTASLLEFLKFLPSGCLGISNAIEFYHILEFFVVFMLDFLHENFMHFEYHEFSTEITHFLYFVVCMRSIFCDYEHVTWL